MREAADAEQIRRLPHVFRSRHLELSIRLKLLSVVREQRKLKDAQGREVSLSPERWLHIVSAHPEIEPYEAEICRAVEAPTTNLPGREPDEEWLYLEGVGPSRWLKVVVVFDREGSGRIITAFARRRKP